MILYTQSSSIELIPFNQAVKRLSKLIESYDKCFIPEAVSPLHTLGLPIRDLRKCFLQKRDYEIFNIHNLNLNLSPVGENS